MPDKEQNQSTKLGKVSCPSAGQLKPTSVYELDLLEYAKYLEDNKQLSYKLLRDRVETYSK